MARSAPEPVITQLPEIGVTVISKWLYNCYVIHDGGDGRPFVVRYGVEPAYGPKSAVVFTHEQTGVGGRVLVVYANAVVEEVLAERIPEMVGR